tara:strand:- start:25 stop:360 length:336 start_codon:yes stop_codon:yes gene_type:complete
MASLYTKVKLYLEANSKTEDELWKETVVLQNDGSGDYIASWNVDGLSKPTDNQLSSYETAGNTAESNNIVDTKRKAEYLSWEEQLDYIYHNGITKWKTDHIKPIKDKYPKE